MAYIYKWIEGRNNLEQYCLNRFKEKPRFVETIGRVGEAKIYYIYKRKTNGSYTDMYLLFMRHEKGTVTDIDNIHKMTYEQIRVDTNAILNG